MNYRRYQDKRGLISLKEDFDELAELVEQSTRDVKKRLDKKKKARIVWAFKRSSELVDKIIENQGLRLYEINLPSHIRGSVGDLEEFTKILEPLK